MGKNERDDHLKKPPLKPPNGKPRVKGKGKEKRMASTKKDEGEIPYCTHYKTEGQMKRLVNFSKGCMLMVIRGKDQELSDAFQGCDHVHKKELCELISNYDEMFQEPRALPLKREIQHEIHLQHDTPLPNIGRYRMSTIEMEEIKNQVQELLNQGVIRLSASPCISQIVLVLKKDGTWRMCMDY
eukprot:PITA_22181